MNSPENCRGDILIPENHLSREHGVFELTLVNGKTLFGISAPDWDSYEANLWSINVDADYIVSPELITVAGVSPARVSQYQDLVERRIESVLHFSRQRPDQIILLGTPVFVGNNKPTNSLLTVQSGEIIARWNKRSGAFEDERNHYDLEEFSTPMLIDPDTSGIICSDLVFAGVWDHRQFRREGLLRLMEHEHLIHCSEPFITDSCKTLIVSSCWGVGASVSDFEKIRIDPDDYYLVNLSNAAGKLMSFYPNLEEVIMVDRAIQVADTLRNQLPEGPYNGRFVRP